jgi:hypothetical protein
MSLSLWIWPIIVGTAEDDRQDEGGGGVKTG